MHSVTLSGDKRIKINFIGLYWFRRLWNKRYYVLIGVLGFILAYFTHYHSNLTLNDALASYKLKSHDQALLVKAEIKRTFDVLYESLRTAARLPGVKKIDRYAENFRGDADQTLQEIYNNIANSVAISELYIVSEDFDPDAYDPNTKELQTPIVTYDELIVGQIGKDDGDGNDEGKIEEIEIYEYYVMRKQIEWLRSRFPNLDTISGLDYPALGGPEVITCDNSRYSALNPNDKDRSGLVYSVPFYGPDNLFKGLVTGVILTRALQDLLPTASYVLSNPTYNYTIYPKEDGQWQISKEWADKLQADPNLIYSEVLNIGMVDNGEGWQLWVGRPDSDFWDQPAVKVSQSFTIISYIFPIVLVIVMILYVQIKERSQLQHQKLIQADKMSSLGRMVAGVAHEINTPLGFVRGNVDLLSEELLPSLQQSLEHQSTLHNIMANDDLSPEERLEQVKRLLTLEESQSHEEVFEDAQQLLADSVGGLTSIADLVSSLRDFSHSDTSMSGHLEMNTAIDNALKISHNRMKKSIEITKDYQELPTIKCSPSQINQVLLNILVNAADAMSDQDGQLTIATSTDGSNVMVAITDNGSGIEPEFLPKIFDPFVTSKNVGEGTGLGLSISYNIIKEHGGRIEVDSTVGQGTTFTITLPITGTKK